MTTESLATCVLCRSGIRSTESPLIFRPEKNNESRWIHAIPASETPDFKGVKCVCVFCAMAVSEELAKPKRKG